MATRLEKQVSPPLPDTACEPENHTFSAGSESTALPRETVATSRFGTIEVEEDLIITLPEGLIGFEGCTRYVIVHHDENSAFRWLQSLEEPAAAFPIMEPGLFRPDYAPTLSDADARFLEITTTDIPILVFSIITVPAGNPQQMTANLLGPIVVNGLTRRGKQVIAQDEGLTTRHRLVEELERKERLALASTAVTVSLPRSQSKKILRVA
ncbi:MAG TPA: flagellar assembly protein FliW [Chthonomonadaceae bacterium]|nr:flagellar assembly protein FliW [Chthonomonadaceae bacterium]